MSEDEIILTHILKVSRAELISRPYTLDSSQKKQYQEFTQRRKDGEPLQYILGTWDFYGLEFQLNSNVLIPRPETEMLVDLALKHFKGVNILDLGCGSGNIGITMAKLLPYVQVTAVDISLEAIEVAISNAQAQGVESRMEFMHANMLDYLVEQEKPFDLIISNPPYIPTADMANLPVDVKQEPVLALDGGADGLDFYRMIIKASPRLITPGGYLMMEFGDGQAAALTALVAAEPQLSPCEINKDLTGRERILLSRKRT